MSRISKKFYECKPQPKSKSLLDIGRAVPNILEAMYEKLNASLTF